MTPAEVAVSEFTVLKGAFKQVRRGSDRFLFLPSLVFYLIQPPLPISPAF